MYDVIGSMLDYCMEQAIDVGNSMVDLENSQSSMHAKLSREKGFAQTSILSRTGVTLK